jgi:putative AbiEi antitoxin of type IV toxin-antitoxin system
VTRTPDTGGTHSPTTTDAKKTDDRKKRRKKDAAAIRKAEQEATRIAARQWSALTSAQAFKAGLSRDQVAYRMKTGRWRQPVRGVYVIAGTPHSWQQTLMVACLAGPAGTVASHLSAAALFGLAKPPTSPQVTIPPRASGRFEGATIFRRRLGPGDTCIRWKVPCMTPTRTIIECAAAGLTEGEALWDLVDSALCKKLMQPSRLVRASGQAWSVSRGRRRGHLERLERALDVWRSGAPAGSPPEARLQRKLIEWGFPRAERQIEIFDEGGKLVARADVGIRELRVLFEYDSDEHHGPRCWLADDARLERIEELGWTVIVIDRFDLRPSNTRLRDELERLSLTRFVDTGSTKRVSDQNQPRAA